MIWTSLLLGAGMLVAYWQSKAPPADDTVARLSSAPHAVSAPKPVQAELSPPVAQPAGGMSVEPRTTRNVARDISREFRLSRNYADYAAGIHAMAEQGDPDAQYYLFAALDFCDREYGALFRLPNQRWRTLDQALARAAVRPTENTRWVERVYATCHTLMQNQRNRYGDARDWLAKATASGHSVAMAKTANDMLIAGVMARAASQLEQPDNSVPRELLAAAVESRDPAVFWLIGEAQPLLVAEAGTVTLNQWAWWLLACQHGYDCGADSLLVEFSCRLDQLCQVDETVESYARRYFQTDYAAIAARTAELAAAIDSGSWAQPGLIERRP